MWEQFYVNNSFIKEEDDNSEDEDNDYKEDDRDDDRNDDDDNLSSTCHQKLVNARQLYWDKKDRSFHFSSYLSQRREEDLTIRRILANACDEGLENFVPSSAILFC